MLIHCVSKYSSVFFLTFGCNRPLSCWILKTSHLSGFFFKKLGVLNFGLIENSLLHKSKAGHGEGEMVRVDRKCEVYV